MIQAIARTCKNLFGKKGDHRNMTDEQPMTQPEQSRQAANLGTKPSSGKHGDLNKEQREAVLCQEPLLVIAGAGTGKTRVITHKIAYLMEQGMRPERILAITFTKKAAKEMAERAQKMTSCRPRFILTFHSLCVKIIRPSARLLEGKFTSSFTIYDEHDTKQLIKEIIKGSDKPYESDDVSYTIDVISSVKQQYCPDVAAAVKELPYPQNTYADIARKYQEKLMEANALDFDDLQQAAYYLLSTYPEVRKHWSDRFDYILLDEMQDTNSIQQQIVNALYTEDKGICAVADPQQTIYTWRGADPKNVFNFTSNFRGKEIKLEQNYRSAGNILDVANETISHIKEEWKDKILTLWTQRPHFGIFRIDEYTSGYDEARAIAEKIRKLAKDGYTYKDTAILCRLNHMMKTIETALVESAIPYQVVGATAFHERVEVKDMMAYLKLLANPQDKASFQRAVNTPPRSVGKKTLAMLASRYQDDWLTTIENASLPGTRMLGLNAFAQLMREVSAYAQQKPYDAMMEILRRINYEGHLKTKFRSDHDDRIGNVSEITNLLKRAQDDGLTLTEFLDDTTLSSSQDDITSEDTVKLMTVHAAKGLEFPIVFVVGLEENMFPSYRALENADSTEEERRCFYVAVTRSMNALYLSHAKSRMKFGETTYNDKSRYITEIQHLCRQAQ